MCMVISPGVSRRMGSRGPTRSAASTMRLTRAPYLSRPLQAPVNAKAPANNSHLSRTASDKVTRPTLFNLASYGALA